MTEMIPTTTSPRIDALITVPNFEGNRSWSHLLDGVRRRAVQLDELGYDGIWLGEHHFVIDSSDAVPNPLLLAADLATRTSKIRLCTGGLTATTWHPVRLAEDIAMLDHFCQGRLDVGFIRGLAPFEINNLNPAADRANNEKNMAIFVENMEIVKLALSHDYFEWKGEQYTLPTPGIKMRTPNTAFTDETGEMVKLSIFPRAFTQPMPTLWSLTDSLSGAVNAAELGLGVVTWFPTGDVLREMMAAHRDGLSRSLGVPVVLGDRFAINRKTIVAPTDAEAREIAEPLVARLFNGFGGLRSRQVWFDKHEDAQDPKFEGISPFDLLMDRDHLLVGSPETVIARMKSMTEAYSIKHWLASFNLAGLSDEHRDRSIELFGREVLPAFRKSL